ncbi:MAG: HTTM domain-containing protein [Longimicrobiaceae bacterium]
MRPLDRLHALVSARDDGRAVALVRIGIAAACAAKLALVQPLFRRLGDPALLHVPYGVGLPVHPGPALAAAWLAAALAFGLGWRTRWAGGALAAAMAATLLADQQLYSNHLYLLAWTVGLLCLADAGARFSLDARRGGAREVPRWPVVLLRVQASAVYFFAAASKVNPDFVTGGVLAASMRWTGPLAVPEVLGNRWVLFALSLATIAVELWLSAALWSRRLRPGAIGLGILLHLGMVATTRPTLELALFAGIMWCLYAAFLPAAGVAAALDRLAAAARRRGAAGVRAATKEATGIALLP